MYTHNARGTDLQSFSETGREWIFPNSWLLFYGGNPHTRCVQPSGHGGGPGGLPRRKFEKKIANGTLMTSQGSETVTAMFWQNGITVIS